MVTMQDGQEEPMMFHYLFEMHRGGKVALRLELNCPTQAFDTVQTNSLMSLEAMLKAYGLQRKWEIKPITA